MNGLLREKHQWRIDGDKNGPLLLNWDKQLRAPAGPPELLKPQAGALHTRWTAPWCQTRWELFAFVPNKKEPSSEHYPQWKLPNLSYLQAWHMSLESKTTSSPLGCFSKWPFDTTFLLLVYQLCQVRAFPEPLSMAKQINQSQDIIMTLICCEMPPLFWSSHPYSKCTHICTCVRVRVHTHTHRHLRARVHARIWAHTSTLSQPTEETWPWALRWRQRNSGKEPRNGGSWTFIQGTASNFTDLGTGQTAWEGGHLPLIHFCPLPCLVIPQVSIISKMNPD